MITLEILVLLLSQILKQTQHEIYEGYSKSLYPDTVSHNRCTQYFVTETDVHCALVPAF